MKRDTIVKRINNAINKDKILKNESQKVKDYFFEIIMLSFQSFEVDKYNESTSSENLSLAIEMNLEDFFYDVYREAQSL